METPIALKDTDLFHVTTKGGEHWIIAWHEDYGNFFERVAVFGDGDRAEDYLKLAQVEYSIDASVLEALPELIKTYPRGVRAEAMAEHLGTYPQKIKGAYRRLFYEARIQYKHTSDTHYKVAAPKDYIIPGPKLSTKQSVVFNALVCRADRNGIVAGLTRRELARLTNTSEGNVTAALEDLERKQFLQKVDGGKGVEASTFQILKYR
jgi:hypothetical protein